MILIIDNYDSFVHNLARYFNILDKETIVCRNDKISLNEAKLLNITHLVISPGPSTPDKTGISAELINYYEGKIPILGVCLGHQLIAKMNNLKVIQTNKPVHGKSSIINHNNDKIFKNIKSPLRVGRYHSLSVEFDDKPSKSESLSDIKVIARANDDTIMAIKHKNFDIYGLQFHPESILTESGLVIIENFVDMGQMNL